MKNTKKKGMSDKLWKIQWLGSIVLIVTSFFLNYSMHTLFVLISFIGVLVAQGIYTRWKVFQHMLSWMNAMLLFNTKMVK